MSPYSGWDPQESGQGATGFDPVGNSVDPSFYFAVSPGGRFPGDEWSYLEGAAGQDRGPGRTSGEANPAYDLPSWLEHIPGSMGNVIARLVRGHEANVRNNADAPVYNPLRAGDVYQGWSGPGAPYGPAGGPLHGLLDQGSDHLGDFDYGQDMTNPQPAGNAGRHGGHGHAPDFGPLNWQPYAGSTSQSQFVDWQPTAPFGVDTSPTRFVPGGGSSTPRPTATSPVPPPFLPSSSRSGGGGGGSSGGGRHAGGGGSNGNNARGNAGADNGMPPALAEVLRQLFPGGMPGGAGSNGSRGTASGAGGGDPFSLRVHPDQAPSSFRGLGERGYDTNYLERGTPGWTRDATTGILNTAGMPLSTPRGRGLLESQDEYITALHDMGYDNESIMGMMNEWGTGGVVRGPGGAGSYMFANDPRASTDVSVDPFNVGSGMFTLGGGGGGSASGGRPDDTGGALASGWNPTAMYF